MVYFCCVEKKLVYVVIVLLTSCPPSFCAECMQINMQLFCNVYSVFDAECVFCIFCCLLFFLSWWWKHLVVHGIAGPLLDSLKSATFLSNLLQGFIFNLKLSVLKMSCPQHLRNLNNFILLNNGLFRLRWLYLLIYFILRKFIKRYIPKNTVL